MESYQEFLTRLQKRGPKAFHLSHCLGTRDAWKWHRKNKWKSLDGTPVLQGLYSCIINLVNQNIAEKILEGHRIDLPHQMGGLLLSSLPTRVAKEGNQLKTNYRTDWVKTLRLWYKDEEARNSHQTIKRIQKNIYFIRYYKNTARYRNKTLYSFHVNRELRKQLGKRVDAGMVLAECLDKL